MRKGTVKFYDKTKGFGFIKELETGEEFYVRKQGLLVGELDENDLVEFEITEGRKGPNAINVKKSD